MNHKQIYLEKYNLNTFQFGPDFNLWKELVEYMERTEELRKTEKFKQLQEKRNNFQELKAEDHIKREITNYLPPYTFEEVHKFEQENNIMLPIEFKMYLLEISSCIYKKHLEFQKVYLENSPFLKDSFPWQKTLNVCPYRYSEDQEYNRQYINDHHNKDFETNNELEDFICDNYDFSPSQIDQAKKAGEIDPEFNPKNNLLQGSMTLREVGCGYQDIIILNGQYYGNVCYESFGGDDPI